MASAALTAAPKLPLLHRNPNSTPKLISSRTYLSFSHLLPSSPSIPTILRYTPPRFTMVSASSTLSPPPSGTPSPFISDSTRTVTSIVALGLSLSKLFIIAAAVNTRSAIHTVGPLFFAALRNRAPRTDLNTPLTVVAAGMSKWLDIYSGVLMVRVLLSWFPNIPWDRQPLSAIRDLCDPYLNLFRNIIPPIFDTLDVSPLLAFAVLGTLGSILNNSRASY
ncbi:hypothetical protein QJS04_geneDACA000825 [Acorus gramineus]|uniref:YGGT family protein n=1 Tax=Acorus gramineus TaxID=55184 RepID=A0AAV9BGQ9_ACOGR|nr:hypothetical protein QJS04_geneDACA000825 [Acorus gramineus]